MNSSMVQVIQPSDVFSAFSISLRFLEIGLNLDPAEVASYPSMPPGSNSTDENLNQGDDHFLEQVYDELRLLAHSKMSKEFKYSTLQGTALVHEAWIRLGADEQPHWQNKDHFFGAAAEAMRRILVDRARKRNREKHGRDQQRLVDLDLNNLQGELSLDQQFLVLNEALEKLEALDAQKAQLVKLRYFFGMSFEEAAKTMGISIITAKRWWAYSRSWLQRTISSSD